MNSGEIAIIVWYIISGLIMANQHDKPKEGKYNWWWWLVASALNFLLFYWAGLFHGT